jgi:cell division protein YceG involved in septum cleavage
VADAAGHHRFARSFEEHNKNVATYRRAMRGQIERRSATSND